MRSLAAAGIDTTWVESGTRPTGTVDVKLVDGEPQFTVSDGAAWEAIRFDRDLADLRPTLLYFGTVALKTADQPGDPSHSRLPRAQAHPPGPEPASGPALARSRDEAALDMATIVKMNEEEWQFVREMTSRETPAGLMEDFGLEMIALTRGSMGAKLYVSGEKYVEDVPKVTVVDTIGAGDAFSAALAAGVIRGAPPRDVLRIACRTGAAAVEGPGALVDLPAELRNVFARDHRPDQWSSFRAGCRGQAVQGDGT